MSVYILRRFMQMIPVLLVASFAIFLLLHSVPGDAALMYAGPDASEDDIEAIRRSMGLDAPVLVQYGRWLWIVVRGDLGVSFMSGYPVTELLGFALPASVELAIAALALSLVVGLTAGAAAALRQGTAVDWVVSGFSSIALSVPNFWLGILAVLTFSLTLGWFPTSGRVPFTEDPIRALYFLTLPAATLGLRLSGIFARFTRAALLDVYHEDFIRTARAKGVSEGMILVKHVFRIALIPITTVIGTEFGRLVGGVVVVEAIFAWPGVGRLLLQAIGNRDFVVVQGTLLVLILIFIFINLLVDLLYAVLNPRIRLS